MVLQQLSNTKNDQEKRRLQSLLDKMVSLNRNNITQLHIYMLVANQFVHTMNHRTLSNFQISTENQFQKEVLTRKFKKEHREKEEELRNAAGKRPFFLKKSHLRQMLLKEKYQKLKETAQLDQFLEKKRRHRASQAHTLIPRTRRSGTTTTLGTS